MWRTFVHFQPWFDNCHQGIWLIVCFLYNHSTLTKFELPSIFIQWMWHLTCCSKHCIDDLFWTSMILTKCTINIYMVRPKHAFCCKMIKIINCHLQPNSNFASHNGPQLVFPCISIPILEFELHLDFYNEVWHRNVILGPQMQAIRIHRVIVLRFQWKCTKIHAIGLTIYIDTACNLQV